MTGYDLTVLSHYQPTAYRSGKAPCFLSIGSGVLIGKPGPFTVVLVLFDLGLN